MSRQSNSLGSLLREKLAFLVVVSACCVGVQYYLLGDGETNGPLKIWQLPTKFGGVNSSTSLCIQTVCGAASLWLLYVGPVVGVISSFLYDFIRRHRIYDLAKRSELGVFINYGFQAQFVAISLVAMANAVLGGAFITEVFQAAVETWSILNWNVLIVIMTFVSSTLSSFSNFARQTKFRH